MDLNEFKNLPMDARLVNEKYSGSQKWTCLGNHTEPTLMLGNEETGFGTAL